MYRSNTDLESLFENYNLCFLGIVKKPPSLKKQQSTRCFDERRLVDEGEFRRFTTGVNPNFVLNIRFSEYPYFFDAKQIEKLDIRDIRSKSQIPLKIRISDPCPDLDNSPLESSLNIMCLDVAATRASSHKVAETLDGGQWRDC
ncbi:hypothetical protein YC2023_034858 [Brassica napus]